MFFKRSIILTFNFNASLSIVESIVISLWAAALLSFISTLIANVSKNFTARYRSIRSKLAIQLIFIFDQFNIFNLYETVFNEIRFRFIQTFASVITSIKFIRIFIVSAAISILLNAFNRSTTVQNVKFKSNFKYIVQSVTLLCFSKRWTTAIGFINWNVWRGL